MKTAAELFAEAKQRITEVSAEQVREMRQRGDDVAIIDVREPNEWNLGHLPGALHIPRGVLESGIERCAVPRERKVVLYCASGNRSALAAEMLGLMGYQDVASMAGGFKAWAHAGGEVED